MQHHAPLAPPGDPGPGPPSATPSGPLSSASLFDNSATSSNVPVKRSGNGPAEGRVECDKCSNIAPSLQEHEIHRRSAHTTHPILQCPYKNCKACIKGDPFPNKVAFQKHLDDKHPKHQFYCDDCKIVGKKNGRKGVYKTIQALDTHIIECHGKEWDCKRAGCGEVFTHHPKYLKHLKKHVKEEEKEERKAKKKAARMRMAAKQEVKKEPRKEPKKLARTTANVKSETVQVRAAAVSSQEGEKVVVKKDETEKLEQEPNVKKELHGEAKVRIKEEEKSINLGAKSDEDEGFEDVWP